VPTKRNTALTTHVIWDWNGTILNDVQFAVDVMQPMLKEQGLPPLDVARYRALFGFPVRDYYRALGFSDADEDFIRVANAFISGFETGIRNCGLRSGVLDTLRELADRDLSQSILSAARQVSLRDQVQHHGIEPFFEEVLGLDNHYAAGKTEIGRRWAESTQHPLDEVVFVGDTAHDFEVSQAMGVGCILVAGGHQDRARLEACGCPIIDSIEELTSVLRPAT